MERCSFTSAESLAFKLPILENIFHKDNFLAVYRQDNIQDLKQRYNTGEHECR